MLTKSSLLRRKTIRLTLIVVACLSAAIWLTLYALNLYNQAERRIDFSLKTIDEVPVQLSDIKEQKILINYWASWCAPCREEIPAFNRAWPQLKSSNIAMLAINYGEDKQSVSNFLKDYPINFTVLLDEDNIASENMQIKVMPTTLIVNQQGDILKTYLGPRDWDSAEIIAEIKAL